MNDSVKELPIKLIRRSSIQPRSLMPLRATRSDDATRQVVTAKSLSRLSSAYARSLGPGACPFAMSREPDPGGNS